MKNILKPVLALIDGSSYLYRAYYAIPSFGKEKPTNAIYGFLNMLQCFLLTHKPNYFIIVFDKKGKTFRHILFKKYKANRVKMPENLKNQIIPLKKIIKNLKIPLFSIHGFEADDVIGTLTKYTKKKFKVLISTLDKDFLQLVDKNVFVITNKKNFIIGPEEVKKKYGISSKLIIDFLALTGDKIDNIPGVPGIGKKTAVTLLNKLGNLKDIYNKIDEVSRLDFKRSKHIKKMLKENKKIAFLSYKLIKIKTNIPLNIKLKSINLKKTNALINFYKKKTWEK